MNINFRTAVGKGSTIPFIKSLTCAGLLLVAGAASAMPFYFSTEEPDGIIAIASRPHSAGQGLGDVFEIESADDFVLTQETKITNATFTGLLAKGATANHITSISVEIYRVFPFDSDMTRTTNSPTRINSPADVALATRESSSGELQFSATRITSLFQTAHSILPGDIHAKPNQTTFGSGPIVGNEVLFSIDFTTPLDLVADHYFFVPQVALDTGEFFWLSAPKPIITGTVFPPGASDFQTWTRDEFLDPDWLRVGGDIIGGNSPPSFNAAFSLTGATIVTTVAEPGSLLLMALGGFTFLLTKRRIRK